MTKLHETTAEHCSACARLTKRSSRWGCLECSPTPKGACENCRTTEGVRFCAYRGPRGLNLCTVCAPFDDLIEADESAKEQP